MSATKKRLDLQFGSFACSVRGFKNPVQPVQQVLQALQNLLEETPELADASISFDADAIDRLMGEVARRADIDEENVEIVPGLIIVHRPGATAGDQDQDEDWDEDEDWPPREAPGGKAPGGPFAEDEPEAEDEEDEEEDEEPAAEEAPRYVNIFSPGGQAGGAAIDAAEDAGDTGVEDGDQARDSFGDQLRRIDADESDEAEPLRLSPSAGGRERGPARDIFAETGGTGGGSVFADPMGGDEPSGGDDDEQYTPINLFTSAAGREGAAEAQAAATTSNLFAELAAADAGAGAGPGRVEHLFGDPETEPGAEDAEEGRTAAALAKAAGAETVPELMVSAAAWMVLLQGQTTFSRRDVIKVFETIPGDHPDSLEARIKGFGKAVRNGQLVMVEDGVFGLSRSELERFQSLL